MQPLLYITLNHFVTSLMRGSDKSDEYFTQRAMSKGTIPYLGFMLKWRKLRVRAEHTPYVCTLGLQEKAKLGHTNLDSKDLASQQYRYISPR